VPSPRYVPPPKQGASTGADAQVPGPLYIPNHAASLPAFAPPIELNQMSALQMVAAVGKVALLDTASCARLLRDTTIVDPWSTPSSHDQVATTALGVPPTASTLRTSFYMGLLYVHEWQGGHRAVRSSCGDTKTCAVCVWDSLGGGASVFDLLSSTFPTPTRHVPARLPDWTFTYMISGT
jgi:hypothetical protein